MRKMRAYMRSYRLSRRGKWTVLFVLLFTCMLTAFFSQVVSAQPTEPRTKRAVSVQIEAGDTLWELAEQYYSTEFSSLSSYIEEIKRTNQLSGDTIHAGCYLIIPYYCSVPQEAMP